MCVCVCVCVFDVCVCVCVCVCGCASVPQCVRACSFFLSLHSLLLSVFCITVLYCCYDSGYNTPKAIGGWRVGGGGGGGGRGGWGGGGIKENAISVES